MICICLSLAKTVLTRTPPQKRWLHRHVKHSKWRCCCQSAFSLSSLETCCSTRALLKKNSAQKLKPGSNGIPWCQLSTYLRLYHFKKPRCVFSLDSPPTTKQTRPAWATLGGFGSCIASSERNARWATALVDWHLGRLDNQVLGAISWWVSGACWIRKRIHDSIHRHSNNWKNITKTDFNQLTIFWGIMFWVLSYFLGEALNHSPSLLKVEGFLYDKDFCRKYRTTQTRSPGKTWGKLSLERIYTNPEIQQPECFE